MIHVCSTNRMGWDTQQSSILQVKSLFKSLFQSMSNNNRDACLSKHCNYTANLGWIHTHKHIAGAAQACAERPLWERRKMRGSRYEKYRYTRRAGPSRPDQTMQTTQQAPTHTHTSHSVIHYPKHKAIPSKGSRWTPYNQHLVTGIAVAGGGV